MQARIFVLTGPPGAGKSSTIRALEEMGYSVLHEAATRVHEEYEWSHPEFRSHVIKQQLSDIASARGLTFMDRSPIDTKAYFDRAGEHYPYDSLEFKEIQKKIFFLPEIIDREVSERRPESIKERSDITVEILKLYIKCGFEIVLIPRMSSPEERARHILKYIE